MIIFEPKEVFAACIEEHGDWLKDYMYMYSEDSNTHAFKNSITRKYVTVKAAVTAKVLA